MRLTSVALAFLFFTNVLATPINGPLARGNAVALRRRNPNGGDGSSNSKAAMRKRATPNELIAALNAGRRTIVGDTDCSVFHLTTKVDNENVVVKVILNGLREEKIIEDEAWALHNVKQLLGWGHTPNKKLYYLFMKNMGVSLQWVPFKNDHERVRELQREAEKSYLSHYHLMHNDHSDPNEHADPNESPQNWAFREVDGVWRAELIDWERAIKEKGHKDYKNPPEPFVIHPDRDFVPRMMKKYLDSIQAVPR